MESIYLSSLAGQTYFTSAFPDILVPVSSGRHAIVTISCGGNEVLNEHMWPSGDSIRLTELGSLLEPYVQSALVATVAITAQEYYSGTAVGSPTSAQATVIFARADVGVSASEFYSSHFLSILQGEKVTALGRKEYLWFYGSATASVTATFSDGSTSTFTPSVTTGSSTYSCIDVSPENFTVTGKQLCAYTVTAGSRSQTFVLDPDIPDCAPILEYYNSFGVWELLYCTGTHKVAPEYSRSSARIGGMLRNYKIEEKRKFIADTGFLTPAMAAWADELFRSDEVYVVNVIGGQVVDIDGGKEVVITDSKSEITNEEDMMPHFSFTYMYAQRIQNVLQQNRVGRIFDNTFDHTFN